MSVKKSNTWSKASIFDPATGDVAQMNTLISPETFLAPEEYITQEKTDGVYQSGTRWRVQFASSDWDAYAQIKEWADANTPVQAVAAAESLGAANLQWYESVEVKIIRTPKTRRADGDSFFVCEMMYEGDQNAAIFNNVNLLHEVNVNGTTITGFVDLDSNGVADGYTSNLLNPTFISGVQAQDGGAGERTLRKLVQFPISGISLTVSELTVSLANAGNEMTAVRLNFAGSQIDFTDLGISATIINSINFTTSSNIYTIDIRFCKINGATSGTRSMTNPSLRTDRSATYIAG